MAEFGTFVGSSYRSQSPVSDQEELINWYVEAIESAGAASPASLYPTPGVVPFATATGVGGRAMHWGNTTAKHVQTETGRAFAVFGGTFQEVHDNGTVTVIGAVDVDENPATISTNGDASGHLFITSGGKGYCYDMSTGVLQVIPGLVATQGASLHGYFIAFNRPDSEIRFSAINDGTNWPTLQFFQRTFEPDPWRAMIVTPYAQLFLVGSRTGEVWFNTGESPLPFAPDPSGSFSYGCAATFSIAILGDSVVWLGKTPDGGIQVMQAKGYRPERISTHAVEFEGASYARTDDAIGQVYTEQGHTFYLLTFPSANVTWCYDERAPEGRRWHKRGTWVSEKDEYHYWRPVFHCFAFNKHLMADRESGLIYHMANRFPKDVDDRVIRRLRRSPSVQKENQLVNYNWFELLLETGLGQDTKPYGPPPVVMLRLSKDSGRTWGDERQASSGPLGAYPTRVFWNRIGQARQRVFEVTVSDPVRNWRVTSAYLRVSGAGGG